MKNIKSFKLFLEEVHMKPEIDLFSSIVQLFHCGDHIWAIKSPDRHTRALMFLRAQEFYESAFEEIIQKQFKVSRFMDVYKQHYGRREFTYGSDWSGFNIPSNILEECMFNIPEDEINNWDKLMITIINKIKEKESGNKYYLLGVDELESDLLEHEFAHAMYFTLPEYKKEMDRLTSECPVETKEAMFKCITEYGYADHVLPDEMQAYMATGLGDMMIEANIPDIDKWCDQYRKVFNNWYQKTLYKNPKEIDTNW